MAAYLVWDISYMRWIPEGSNGHRFPYPAWVTLYPTCNVPISIEPTYNGPISGTEHQQYSSDRKHEVS